jgi:hypothetical protein
MGRRDEHKKLESQSTPPLQCPKCKSTHLGGLMESFWVPLNADGTPDGDWGDWSGETEVRDKRMCYDCEHEFEA